MGNRLTRILMIADLEGSSGCWSYTASSFLTDEWCQASLEMSQDVSTVVSALFEAGVKIIVIKDFHRTGYNLFPELIDSRATLISGYRRGPFPVSDIIMMRKRLCFWACMRLQDRMHFWRIH